MLLTAEDQNFGSVPCLQQEIWPFFSSHICFEGCHTWLFLMQQCKFWEVKKNPRKNNNKRENTNPKP